jgi:hypothetical protein
MSTSAVSLEHPMRKVVLIVFVALAMAWGFHGWRKATTQDVAQRESPQEHSEKSFASLPVRLVNTPGIVIIAPLNCTSAQAEKADRLASALRNMNIPVTRSQTISWTDTPPSFSSREEAEAHMKEARNKAKEVRKIMEQVMGESPPLVFVNYRFKSDPDLEDVLNEYRRGR